MADVGNEKNQEQKLQREQNPFIKKEIGNESQYREYGE